MSQHIPLTLILLPLQKDENDYKIQNSSLIDVDTSIIGFNAAVEFITVELLLTMSNTDDVNTDDLSLT